MENESSCAPRWRLLTSKVAQEGQSIALLVTRLLVGSSFYFTGRGKLIHLEKTTEFFTSLHIPAPKLQAVMAGSTEMVGGLLLAAGLASRLISVPLAFTMLVAYATAEREALLGIFSNPNDFVGAAPFPFLVVCLWVIFQGAGRWSLDQAICSRMKGCSCHRR